MSAAYAEQAWQAAQAQGLHCHAIVEAGLLNDPARLQLLQSTIPKQPLMQQPEFAALREHGPWLLDCSSLRFADVLALEGLSDSQALMGWVSTQCPLNILAEHLSDALLAADESGYVYLLRTYTPAVLPQLHGRNEAPWHSWLFGPLQGWWLPSPEHGWQSLQGEGLASPGDYHPISLDEQLWQLLELDPLTYSLTAELENSAADVFTTTCHGERLSQVQQALDAARDQGLQQPEDLSLFATLHLFDSQFPTNWPNWPQVRQRVTEQRLPLGQALRMQSA